QDLLLVDALEVQVHDHLLVRMALDVAQDHALDLAVDIQAEGRRVEPLVLLRQPDLLLVQLDQLRLALAAVNDAGKGPVATQAAARTLTLDAAASGLDGLFGHVGLLVGYSVAPPRGGMDGSPATRRAGNGHQST